MTPEQRKQRAKIAANARWSRPMAREDHSDVMKEVMRVRFEREVDPEGKLPPDERAKLMRAAGRRRAAELNAAKARKREIQRRAASLGSSSQDVHRHALDEGRVRRHSPANLGSEARPLVWR